MVVGLKRRECLEWKMKKAESNEVMQERLLTFNDMCTWVHVLQACVHVPTLRDVEKKFNLCFGMRLLSS